MRGMTTWRVVQGTAIALVIAGVLLVTDQPLPDYCRWCDTGELSWWFCALAGCLW